VDLVAFVYLFMMAFTKNDHEKSQTIRVLGHKVYENSDTDVTVSGPLKGHRELLHFDDLRSVAS
jgi:hypothetical protein